MKRLVLLVLAPLALALAACGLVPPVPVNDPLRLHGAPVVVQVEGAGASIAVQQVNASGATEEPVQFADRDLGLPLNPAGLRVNGGFADTVTVVAGAHPDTLQLSNIELSVRVWDGAGDFDSAPTDRRIDVNASWTGTLSLTRVGDCLEPQDPCEYRFDDAELASDSLRVSISGDNMNTLFAIIQEAPQPNFVEATLEMQVTGAPFDLQAGDTLIFNLDMQDGEVRVF